MKKCYIAGRITGLPVEEYEANFKQAEEEVRKLGYEPVNPCELHDCKKTYLACLKHDIKVLMDCQAVYALSGWMKSKGAQIEVRLAIDLGFKIHYQSLSQRMYT